VPGSIVEDADILRALAASRARVLIIGRRALVILGLPVVTSDYDFWVHIDDIELLNAAFEELEHAPNKTPEQARAAGRYVLENGEHIDVMVARARSTPSGESLDFDAAWRRRSTVTIAEGISVCLPAIDDLITTKRWASRAKDVADIQLLEALKKGNAT
jgi:hypothetical protein